LVRSTESFEQLELPVGSGVIAHYGTKGDRLQSCFLFVQSCFSLNIPYKWDRSSTSDLIQYDLEKSGQAITGDDDYL
jgi:hypothetical protein